MSELGLRWHVFRARRKSDTSTRFLLELARCVARAPRGPDPAPILEIGTRAGGSALLILRVLDDVYRAGTRRPLLVTVDPYGSRPYEGAPFEYDERHYRAMKRALARYGNHVHYMMDSAVFIDLLPRLSLWVNGAKRPLERFTLVYLDGSHDPDIVWREIDTLLPMVVPGGYLIVDDTDWFEGAVRRRLDDARASLPGPLRHNGKQSIVSVEAGGGRGS